MRWLSSFALLACLLAVAANNGSAQDTNPPNDEPTVRLNLPNDVEIKGLVDFVSEKAGIRILYDEKIASRKLSIRASDAIPVSSLPALLQSALRLKGLALVDADVPGWKKIVESAKLPEIATTDLGPNQVVSGATAVTQAFTLKHLDAMQLDQSIKPFLTPQAGNSIALKDQRVIIVTDFASNLARLARLIEMIDRPKPTARTETFRLRFTDAGQVAEQLTSLLEARAKVEGQKDGQSVGVSVFKNARTNQLIVVGDHDRVSEVKDLIKVFDVAVTTRTEIYSHEAMSTKRLEKLIRSLVDPENTNRLLQINVDDEGNALIINTTSENHKRIREFVNQLGEAKSSEARSRIKFYKLKHIAAADALKTLKDLESSTQSRESGNRVGNPAYARDRLRENQFLPGPNRPAARPGMPTPEPPALQPNAATPDARARNVSRTDTDESAEPNVEQELGRARVTADTNSNSLVVIGDPLAQKVYGELIQALDQQRPQVLIEARVVVLDTSDDFSLGVELSGGDRKGSKRTFNFSSFGLSTADAVSGALKIVPGLGYNGTLVDPDVADVVIRAVTTHRRAKVVSSPRVLVNDNATGTLSSVAEIPFTSVNASQTVATTSFAGYASAGTTIEVTPHISDRDQLQLEFKVSLNDFQGSPSAAGVPPPRQTDEIDSQVTIPDGHTLIVGGLNRQSLSDRVDTIPFVENIPVVKELFRNRTNNSKQSTLFIFLRPVILRDDKFRDLKYLSERDLSRGSEPKDHPTSLPRLIR